jgi:hypothetical protein
MVGAPRKIFRPKQTAEVNERLPGQVLREFEAVRSRSWEKIATPPELKCTPNRWYWIDSHRQKPVRRLTRDRCYDFSNIFAKKSAKNWRVFYSKQSEIIQNFDHDIGF